MTKFCGCYFPSFLQTSAPVRVWRAVGVSTVRACACACAPRVKLQQLCLHLSRISDRIIQVDRLSTCVFSPEKFLFSSLTPPPPPPPPPAGVPGCGSMKRPCEDSSSAEEEQGAGGGSVYPGSDFHRNQFRSSSSRNLHVDR